MATATLATPTIPDALPAPDKVISNADRRSVTVRWSLPVFHDNGGQEHVELTCSHNRHNKTISSMLCRITERDGIIEFVLTHRHDAPLRPATVHVSPCPRYSAKKLNEHVDVALDAMATMYRVGDEQVTRFFDETHRLDV